MTHEADMRQKLRKYAGVLVLAILLPSLVLAGLALQSLQNQQVVLERQQSLLYQNVADDLVLKMERILERERQLFAQTVESILVGKNPGSVAASFDSQLKSR